MKASSKDKLVMLVTAVCAILVSYAPLIYGHVAFVEARVSRHDVMVFLVLPFLSLLLMIATLLVARKALHLHPLFGLAWVRGGGRLDLLGVLVLPVILVTIDRSLRHVFGASYVGSGRVVLSEPLSIPLLSLYVFRSIVAIPILEEVFWRGYIQDSLQRISNWPAALFTQAAAFAVLHLRNMNESAVIFLFALVLGLWRCQRRTLLPLIAAHVVVNIIGILPFVQDDLAAGRIKITHNYGALLEQLGMRSGYALDDNANLDYPRAFELLVRMPDSLVVEDSDVWPTDLSPEKIGGLREWMASNEKAVIEFEKATRKPYYLRDYGAMPFEQIVTPPFHRKAGGMVAILVSRARLSAIDGYYQQTISDIVTCCRFAQHLMGPKPLNEQMLGLDIQEYVLWKAFEILSRNRTDVAWSKALRDQLDVIPHDVSSKIDFSGQRLVCHDVIQRSFTCDDSGQGRIPKQVIMSLMSDPRNAKYGIEPWERIERRSTVRLTDEVFAYLDSIRDQTPVQLLQAGQRIKDVVPRIANGNVYLLTQVDRFEDYYYLAHECGALRNALVLTAALIQYRMERGDFPEDLDELVMEGYVRAIPSDPFSGSPFVYRKTDRDFLLYSFGPDFDDDGGVGYGPNNADGDDVFWPILDSLPKPE